MSAGDFESLVRTAYPPNSLSANCRSRLSIISARIRVPRAHDNVTTTIRVDFPILGPPITVHNSRGRLHKNSWANDMKVGTKSLLVGVHQSLWHPITVYRAWLRLYGRPDVKETLCIIVHDWGYWGASEMDGLTGARHPERGAMIAARLLGDKYRDLVLLHSRRYARDRDLRPSKLCWADKLSIVYEPAWFYLLRARISGELDEYRNQAAAWVPLEKSNREWLIWIKRRFARAVISGTRVEGRRLQLRIDEPNALNVAADLEHLPTS